MNRSTITRWESTATESDDSPNVIPVDDRKIFISGSLPILEEVLPDAILALISPLSKFSSRTAF